MFADDVLIKYEKDEDNKVGATNGKQHREQPIIWQKAGVQPEQKNTSAS